MTEDQLGNVDVVLFVDLDWDAFAVVWYWDVALFTIDLNLQGVHFIRSLIVIGSIDKDFIENFI